MSWFMDATFHSSVAPHLPRAEIRKGVHVARRARVVGTKPFTFRREAECERNVERVYRTHLTIEPRLGVRPEAVRPTQSRPDVGYTQFPQPADRRIEPRVLEMEPLADPELRSACREIRERQLWRAVLAQQAHVEVPVIRRSLRFAMPRGCRPGARQVVETVPMN